MRIGIVGGIFQPRNAARGWVAPESVLADGLEESGVEVLRIPHGGSLPQLELDVIHIHHLGRALLAALGVPGSAAVVLTPHDGRLISGRGGGAGRKAMAHVGARRTDAVVVLGQAEWALWTSLGVPPGRLRVIPNGIPLYPFGQVNPADIDREGILFVGQLVPVKGVQELIAAFSRVDGSCQPRLRLAYQNAALEQELLEVAIRFGVGSRVDFLGYRTPAELAMLYRSTAVVVLPSHAEVLPSVLTEALLGGARVVASRVGCVAEQLGSHGALVEAGDIEGLTHAMQASLAEPWRRGEALTRHEWARSRYSVSAMIEGHLRLYRDLLEGRLARRSRGKPERTFWRFGACARTVMPGAR